MAFDGGRALIVGDYVTPSSGRYAGQLGPWSGLVQAVGIAPRSTLMNSIFVGNGLVYLAALGLFLSGHRRGRPTLVALAGLGLWYLPFGTVCTLLVLGALGAAAGRSP